MKFTAVRVQAKKVTATYPPQIWGDTQTGPTWEKGREPEELGDPLPGGGRGRLRTCKPRLAVLPIAPPHLL